MENGSLPGIRHLAKRMEYIRALMASIAIVFVIASSLTVNAQDSETQEIIDKIEAMAKATGGYHADYVMVDSNQKTRRVTKGQMKQKWPYMRWAEIRRSKDDRLIGFSISNGVTRWNYLPKYKLALKRNAHGHEWIDKQSVRHVRTEFLGGEEVYVIEAQGSAGIPVDNLDFFGRTEFYIGTQDGIIRQAIIFNSKNKIKGTQIFFNIRPDPSISEEDFEFVPPQGTQIFDLDSEAQTTHIEK